MSTTLLSLTAPDDAVHRDASLAALLAPLAVEEFLGGTLGSAPLLIRGDTGRFEGLFGWSDVNEILAAQRLDRNGASVSRLVGVRRWHVVGDARSD